MRRLLSLPWAEKGFHERLALPLFNALYHGMGWLLAGTVLGAVIRPHR
jgi:hypothetical protein